MTARNKRNSYRDFNKAVLFMALTSLTILTRTSDEGYYSAVISTLEIRFQMKSFQLAIVQTIASVSSFTTVLILGYFSDFSHKPLIIAFVGMLTAAGTLLQALPRILYNELSLLTLGEDDDYFVVANDTSGSGKYLPVCKIAGDSNLTEDLSCTGEEGAMSGALWDQVSLLLIGKLIQSFGQELTPILAITYIDDSPCSKLMPAFLVILGASKRAGFIVGGLLASMTLHIPSSWPFLYGTDFLEQVDSSHPNFLGAWWLGFAIHGVVMILLALPMACFPRRMKYRPGYGQTGRRRKRSSTHTREAAIQAKSIDSVNGGFPRRKISQVHTEKQIQCLGKETISDVIKEQRENEDDKSNKRIDEEKGAKDNDDDEDDDDCDSGIGYFRSLGRVLANPVILTLFLAENIFYYAAFAVGPYLTKYVEIAYSLSKSQAAYIRVYAKTPSILVGYLICILFMTVFKLRRHSAIICVAVSFTVVAIITPAQLFTGCENKHRAGITDHYEYSEPENASLGGLSGEYSIQLPNLTSSCNALCDCEEVYAPVCGSDGKTYFSPCHAGCTSQNETVYGGCSCVDGDHTTASFGECNQEGSCWLAVSIIIIAIISSIDSFVSTPKQIVKIKFVQKKDRSMALSVSKFLSGLSKLPSHMAFGWLFDQSCLLFQTSCEQTGNCLVYDLRLVRHFVFGVAAIAAFFSSSFAVLSMLFAIRPGARGKMSFNGKNKKHRSEEASFSSAYLERVTYTNTAVSA